MPQDDTKHAGRRKTCRRYNDAGHAHVLTFSCFRRQPFLSRDRTRRWMIESIAATRDKHALDIWAYVIMPEHVHILLCPRHDDYDIGRILTSLKQPVSKRAIVHVRNSAPASVDCMRKVGSDGSSSLHFWQRGGGYDRNLWSPAYVWEAIDYIHRNPVRRGLCPSDADWEWSSARAFQGLPGVVLEIDAETLPDDPRLVPDH